MSRFTSEITIDRPLEEVFEFMADPANDPIWQPTLLEVRREREGQLDVGSRVTEVRRFMGRRLETMWEVIEHIPNKRSAIRTIEGPVKATGSYTFEDVGGKTKVITESEFEGSGFFKLAEPVFARMAQREFESNLGHLKDILEARV